MTETSPLVRMICTMFWHKPDRCTPCPLRKVCHRRTSSREATERWVADLNVLAEEAEKTL